MDRNHPSHPSPLRSTSLETIIAAAVVMCAQVLVMFFSRRSSPTMFIWFLQKIALSTQRCHHTLHSHQLRLLPPIAALAPSSFPRSFSSSLHHSQGPLDETTSKKLLVKLNQEILKHDELYYNQAMPLIPDHEYDQLLNQAQDIVNKYPKLKPFFTKSDRVGSVVDLKDESQSYVHSFPMLSLDNTFDEKGLLKFIGDIQSHCSKNNLEYPSLNFTFEPKIDGVSLSLKYVGGKLTSAGTRGDGKIGEAVPHVSSILDIPSYLSTPSSSPSISLPWTDPSVEIEIRGEVYMTDKDFDEVQTKCSESNSKQFSTPRNTVAGTIRSHDPEITSQRKLRFIAYGFYLRNTSASDSAASDNGSWSRNLIPCSSNSMQLPLQSQTLELLSNLGFVTPTGWINLSVPLRDNTQLSSALALVLQQCQLAECRRSQIGYDTDGVVLKLNDVSLQEQLGFRSRSPKWAIAFKFVPKSAITKLLNIEIQVGRTGILTPVAHLSPVVIGGVKIERATLHNQQEITRLGIQPGQYVRVQRSGDVIPKIIESIHPSSLVENSVPASETSQSPFQFPKVCPVCQSPVIVTASKSGDPESVSHRCSGGYACQAQVIEKLKHYCSKGAANIKGLAMATLERLVESGLVTYPSDLYTLEGRQLEAADRKTQNRNPGDADKKSVLLSELKGWGPVSIRNLFKAIDQSRQSLSCARLIYGLGIPKIGEQTARDIAAVFENDFNAFWIYVKTEADAFQSSKQTDFAAKISSIPGIGPVTLESLLKYSSLHLLNDTSAPATVTTQPLNPLRQEVDKLILHLQLAPQPASSSLSALPSAPTAASAATESSASARQLQIFQGKRVVFSGKLSNLTRQQAWDLIEQLGGKVDKQICAQTNLIVVPALATDEEMSVKLRKAKEKGIEIWTESEWREKLRKN